MSTLFDVRVIIYSIKVSEVRSPHCTAGNGPEVRRGSGRRSGEAASVLPLEARRDSADMIFLFRSVNGAIDTRAFRD